MLGCLVSCLTGWDISPPRWKKRNIAQRRAGDAPLAQVVMRLTLYLASGDEGKQEQNCSYGEAMCLNLRWELSSSSENFAQQTWPGLPSRTSQACASTQIKIQMHNFHEISCLCWFPCLTEHYWPVLTPPNEYDINTEHQWQVLLCNISLLSGWWISWTPVTSINGLPLCNYVITPK